MTERCRIAGLVLLAIGLAVSSANLPADPVGHADEQNLLMLRNGGVVVGILPEVGGRIMVFRTDTGTNVLNGQPDLWKAPTPDERAAWSWKWKQYFGESVWSGPQENWWGPGRDWPPDPAWEMDAFSVVEKTPVRAVLRSAVSKQNGMELTKTVELTPDGQCKLSVSAINRGDKPVEQRDLWLIVRPIPTARCFLPLESVRAEDGFTNETSKQEIDGLTVLQLLPNAPHDARGKLRATATAGWIAAALPGCFFTVKFHPADPAKVAQGQAPVEVYFESNPGPLCELERHGEARTLKPGEEMTWEETWQILPYSGPDTVEAQAKFLQNAFPAAPNSNPVKTP